MRNTKKKGFTIVELVIVVAVIAILSSVLIPTVAGLIDKANLTADQQAVRNMNVALATKAETPANVGEAANILAEAGFNAKDTLVPVSSNCKFYWSETYNTVLLAKVEGTEVKLIFPTNNKNLVDNFKAEYDEGKCYDLRKGLANTSVGSVNDANDAIENGENVTLTQNITFTASDVKSYSAGGKTQKAGIFVPAGEAVELDLGGATVTTPDSNYGMFIAGDVTITNGKIASRGLYVVPGATVTLGEGVTIEATGTNGGAAIKNYGGTIIINGGTYTANDGNYIAPENVTNENAAAQPAIIDNRGGYVVINGGTFESDSMAYSITNKGGTMIINDCTLKAKRGGVWTGGNGVTVINGGTFENDYANSGHTLYFDGELGRGTRLEINGGTFTNKAGGTVIYLNGKAACLASADVVIESSLLSKVSG